MSRPFLLTPSGLVFGALALLGGMFSGAVFKTIIGQSATEVEESAAHQSAPDSAPDPGLPHDLRRVRMETPDGYVGHCYVFRWRDRECLTAGASESPILCYPIEEVASE